MSRANVIRQPWHCPQQSVPSFDTASWGREGGYLDIRIALWLALHKGLLCELLNRALATVLHACCAMDVGQTRLERTTNDK